MSAYEFLVSPSLDYDPILEDHDHVRIDHSGQSVGHYQSGPVFADIIQCTLDVPLGLCVQGRSCLIQQDDFGSLEKARIVIVRYNFYLLFFKLKKRKASKGPLSESNEVSILKRNRKS